MSSVVVNLYNQIFRVLSNDTELMTLMSLPTGVLTEEQKVIRNEHIQKRRRPTNVIESLPILTFYTPGGVRERRNDFVYDATYVFDIYTQDDVELAHNVIDRVCILFDGEINPFENIENFEANLVESFESDTDLANTYCFSTVITFSITLRDS